MLDVVSESFYAISNLITEGFHNEFAREKLIQDELTVKDMIKYFIKTLKL